MRASRLNRLVLAATVSLASAASAQAQFYNPGPLYQNREEIRQLTAHLENQVQYVLQVAEQATGYGSSLQQQQAVNTLRLLAQATSQMRMAVQGWHGTADIGYNEFVRVQQLQDQAEREAYVFYYSSETIRQILDQIDDTLARLGFLYQRPGSVSGPGAMLQLTRDMHMQVRLLHQNIRAEAYYGDVAKQAALRDAQQAEMEASQLLMRVQNRFDHPSLANREFAQLRMALNNLRANVYYAGFSHIVHQQLNLVLSRLHQLSVYFRGYAPIVVRPMPPRRPPVVVRPPVIVRPPVVHPRPPVGPRPPVVHPRPPVGPRPPVVVTPPPGRPPARPPVVGTPPPGRPPVVGTPGGGRPGPGPGRPGPGRPGPR